MKSNIAMKSIITALKRDQIDYCDDFRPRLYKQAFEIQNVAYNRSWDLLEYSFFEKKQFLLA